MMGWGMVDLDEKTTNALRGMPAPGGPATNGPVRWWWWCAGDRMSDCVSDSALFICINTICKLFVYIIYQNDCVAFVRS